MINEELVSGKKVSPHRNGTTVLWKFYGKMDQEML